MGVDVCAADNLGTRQRLVLLGLVPQSHDAGHLLLSYLDLATSVRRLLDAADTKVFEACKQGNQSTFVTVVGDVVIE